MSSEPQSTPDSPALDEETQAALRRLSEVVFRALKRLDRFERARERERQQADKDAGETQ
jgi:hypothetical protein